MSESTKQSLLNNFFCSTNKKRATRIVLLPTIITTALLLTNCGSPQESLIKKHEENINVIQTSFSGGKIEEAQPKNSGGDPDFLVLNNYEKIDFGQYTIGLSETFYSENSDNKNSGNKNVVNKKNCTHIQIEATGNELIPFSGDNIFFVNNDGRVEEAKVFEQKIGEQKIVYRPINNYFLAPGHQTIFVACTKTGEKQFESTQKNSDNNEETFNWILTENNSPTVIAQWETTLNNDFNMTVS